MHLFAGRARCGLEVYRRPGRWCERRARPAYPIRVQNRIARPERHPADYGIVPTSFHKRKGWSISVNSYTDRSKTQAKLELSSLAAYQTSKTSGCRVIRSLLRSVGEGRLHSRRLHLVSSLMHVNSGILICNRVLVIVSDQI